MPGFIGPLSGGVFTPRPPLPPEIEAAIEKSTQTFRARLGFFAQDGWIAEYRDELERIARIALQVKKA